MPTLLRQGSGKARSRWLAAVLIAALLIIVTSVIVLSLFDSDGNLPDARPDVHALPMPALQYQAEGELGVPICTVDGKTKIAYSPEIDYDLDLKKERYLVHVPPTYDGKEAYGLIVYISSSPRVDGPPGDWEKVISRRKLIFLAPQRAGNKCAPGKRMGLAVLGALAMLHKYNIDPRRVYAAGLSGGAVTACDLGFYQPDLFAGTIEDCGADFYRPVSKKYRTSFINTEGQPYGLAELSAYHLPQIKSHVRFVLITGDRDFRRGNILDIFNNGFVADQLQCKLIDLPGMGHRDCSSDTLEQSLDYIECKPHL